VPRRRNVKFTIEQLEFLERVYLEDRESFSQSRRKHRKPDELANVCTKAFVGKDQDLRLTAKQIGGWMSRRVKKEKQSALAEQLRAAVAEAMKGTVVPEEEEEEEAGSDAEEKELEQPVGSKRKARAPPSSRKKKKRRVSEAVPMDVDESNQS
jgi:predicted  nucleic acid-binding Zn-ribbon protein